MLGVTLEAILRSCVSSAVVAAASILAQAATAQLLRQWDVPALIQIPLVLGVGGVAWLLVARLQGHPAHDEILTTIAAWRARGRRRSGA